MKHKDFMTGPVSVVEGLLGALSDADDAVSRLDERLAASPLARGWRARMAYHEAIAWTWNMGDLVDVQALVLHDAGLDQYAPEEAVTRARSALVRRRRAAKLDLQALRTWSGVQTLLGRRSAPTLGRSPADAALLAALAPRRDPVRNLSEAAAGVPPLPFLAAMEIPELELDQDEQVFAFWSQEPERMRPWPALVRAVARLDRWMALQPMARETDVGALIVEAELREARRLLNSPLLIERGRRAIAAGARPWSARMPTAERALYWLEAISAGARFGMAELDALSIASQRLNLALKGRRANSRLAELNALFLSTPIVTAPLAARALGVSQQAARTMIGDLDGVVREVTGRRSFRAWRI